LLDIVNEITYVKYIFAQYPTRPDKIAVTTHMSAFGISRLPIRVT